MPQVCRRCAALAREPRLWRALLRREFDLRYALPEGAPGAHWREQYRAVLRAGTQPLRLRAVFTDGGCDGGQLRYSVESLFSPADWEAYWCAPAPHCTPGGAPT